MSTIEDRFASLCPDWDPLKVQRQAAEALGSTGRLIALLPTGSGKTLLGALPFAAGLLQPKQMVFTTPLRTLTDAQSRILQKTIHPDAASDFLGVPWSVRSQTGTAPDDPLFVSSAVVCTFDQALSSALSIAYSTSVRRRGINAGAIIGSYLVCDELHLFPRDEAFTTLFWILKHRPDLPFMLMTATLSRPIAEGLGQLLGATVITDLPKSDIAHLGLDHRRRIVTWINEPLNPERILKSAQASSDGRLIVVVNTVERARELGKAMVDHLGDRVLVLHARFLPEHRARIEDRLVTLMGKGATRDRRPAVLIATQVVEVGLDISAGAMMTEWAPANALVQRWGRCARWGGEGRVIVAPPTPDLATLPLPYRLEKEGQDVLIKTRDWLQVNAGTGIDMTTAIERSFLDTCHGASDERWIAHIDRRLHERSNWIAETIQSGRYSNAGTLIRHIDNRTVLVHGDPEEIVSPSRAAGFSLAAGTLRSLVRAQSSSSLNTPVEDLEEDSWLTLSLPEQSPWVLKRPIWNETSSRRGDECPTRWEPVAAADIDHESLFVINPEIVTYDPVLGLGLRPGSSVRREFWSSERAVSPWSSFTPYRRETYEQHTSRMLAVLDERAPLWPTVNAIADRIESWCGWPRGMLRRVVMASILFHDAGKLTVAWQRWAHEYQRAGGHPTDQLWLVHTDEVPGLRISTPGPHALTGAVYSIAVGQTLDDEVNAWRTESGSRRWEEDVLPSRVIFTAIATHHGAQPQTGSTVISPQELLGSDAIRYIQNLLRGVGLPDMIGTPLVGSTHNEHLVVTEALDSDAGQDAEYVALATVSRLLRLADGWSQEEPIGDELKPGHDSFTLDDAVAGAEADGLAR